MSPTYYDENRLIGNVYLRHIRLFFTPLTNLVILGDIYLACCLSSFKLFRWESYFIYIYIYNINIYQLIES